MVAISVAEDQRFTQVLTESAIADLTAIYKAIPDHTDGYLVKEILSEALPDLVQTYGSLIAQQAAERFMELRGMSTATGRYLPKVAPVVHKDKLISSLGWAITPLFEETVDPDMALRNLLGVTDRLVKAPGRDTLALNSIEPRSKAGGFARVLGASEENCKYCLMASSRGPVYKDAKSAGEGNKWHDNCNCSIVPSFGGIEIAGYDPDALYEQYKKLV